MLAVRILVHHLFLECWQVSLNLLRRHLATLQKYKHTHTRQDVNNDVNAVHSIGWCCLMLCQNILTFWHRSFTFNSNKSPTWCNNFSVYYPDVCLQLNMIRAFSRPSSGAQWLQWQPLVLPSYRGDSRAEFVVGPAGPTTNIARLTPRYEGKTRGCHCSHWAPDDGQENVRNMLSCKQTAG
jgi:hypothetical protein